MGRIWTPPLGTPIGLPKATASGQPAEVNVWSRSCRGGGRKSPSPIDKAHGLYNSLYYRTSRDSEQ